MGKFGEPIPFGRKPRDAYVGTLYGWRRYRTFGTSGLRSLTAHGNGKAFDPTQPAVCGHKNVPDISCGCGYYAYSTIDDMRNDSSLNQKWSMVALVSGYGRIIIHQNGFRAEYMKVEALFARPFQLVPGQARRLRKRYGCEIHRFQFPQTIDPDRWPNVQTNSNKDRLVQVPESELILPGQWNAADS